MSDSVLVRSKPSGSRMRIPTDRYDTLVEEAGELGPCLKIGGIPHPIALEEDQECEGDSLEMAKEKHATEQKRLDKNAKAREKYAEDTK